MMNGMPSRELEQVRETFRLHGVSVAEWARQRGFNANLVYAVLQGKRRGVRGQTHDIMVALGLKEGIQNGLDRIPF